MEEPDLPPLSMGSQKTSLRMAKAFSNNFHKGYLDLQPYYDQKKYERAVELGETWKAKVLKNVGKQVHGVAR